MVLTRRQLLAFLVNAPLLLVATQQLQAGRPRQRTRARGLAVPLRVPVFVDPALSHRLYLPLVSNSAMPGTAAEKEPSRGPTP